MKLLLSTFIVLVTLSYTTTDKVVGCYWGSWSSYRPSIGKFTTNDIRTNLCTHLYYSFIGLNNDTFDVKILDSGIDPTGYKDFTALRKENPDVKFLIAIGGWSQGSYAYSAVAGDATLRQRFIKQIMEIFEEYGFDGLDFDWEYPTQRDSKYGLADKENFVKLAQEIQAAFKPKNYLFTVAVSSNSSYIDVAYDVKGLSDASDLINFMTYDLHGVQDGVTGINAPLTDPNSDVSIKSYVQSWLDAGMDPAKLVVGIPLYGKSYTLSDASKTNIGAAITGAGDAGAYTQGAGTLAYYEILERITKDNWTVVYDDDYQCPYAFKGNQWVGYDDEKSIQAKIDYVLEKNLAGVMTWAIDLDDFNGNFGKRDPLLEALNKVRS